MYTMKMFRLSGSIVECGAKFKVATTLMIVETMSVTVFEEMKHTILLLVD
jgi:hypothetical protein